MRLLALLAVLLPPTLASAHHVISDFGLNTVAPRTSVELSAEVTRFEAGGRDGTWVALAPRLELDVARRVSFFSRLPAAHIRFSDGEERSGVGDTEVGVKAQLVATQHGELIVSAGLGAELPTGDAARGLGGGHVELDPFLGVSSAHGGVLGGELVLSGLVAGRLSLASGHAHGGEAPASILAPHRERELASRLQLSWVRGRGYASLGAEVVTVLSGGDTLGPVTVLSEIGYRAGDHLRIAVGIDAAAAGEARYDARGRTALTWIF